MNRRERVLRSLNFEELPTAPLDLGGMRSTGISAFAYPRLVQALGLPHRPPRIHDTGQMLALPDVDVLDALDCDVAVVESDTMLTNAFEQPERWKPYGFNGRLEAMVQWPGNFSVKADGTILHNEWSSMPAKGFVFNAEHAGQILQLEGDLPKPDLDQIRERQEKKQITKERLDEIEALCKKARESTDRAILFAGPKAGLGVGAYGGIVMFPMLCVMEPDFVSELHELQTAHQLKQAQAVLERVHPYIDVYLVSADDWGNQNQLVASGQVYRDLFKPGYQRFNEMIHTVAPEVKTYLHSCGAIYDLIDDLVESGFDVLNPVQWNAGGHSYHEWKDKARNRIALWGGGVDTQKTLPLGSVEDVRAEVAEVVEYFAKDGGFVFCGIHNLLAETDA
ncbi:MAG: uroporphyrinogen decarboxylase family protein, partial [Candidatus Sumerlaeia bacterium]